MKKRIRVGDCYVIPLPDGRYSYCQCVAENDELGYLIKVFNRINQVPLDSVAALRGTPAMFPPVFVGLKASVRSGRWCPLGTLPVEGFSFPPFRISNGLKPGVYHDWSLWDGKTSTFVGSLPPELRALELKLVWGDELLEERIATGVNPFEGIV